MRLLGKHSDGNTLLKSQTSMWWNLKIESNHWRAHIKITLSLLGIHAQYGNMNCYFYTWCTGSMSIVNWNVLPSVILSSVCVCRL